MRAPRGPTASEGRPNEGLLAATGCKNRVPVEHGTQWRFATGEFVGDRRSLIAAVRGYEAMGYDVFGASDHLLETLAPLTALAMVAEVTERLRVATYVLCNEFRHPAVVAKELATLDVLTDGRVEVGVGAGWVREEFLQTGLDFGTGSERLSRLGEAITIMKRLFEGGNVDFQGEHYRLAGLLGYPPTVQRPHPPIMIGGGGHQMLDLAAREADIVNILPRAAATGGLLAGDFRRSSFLAKAHRVMDAASGRSVSLGLLIFHVEVTTDRRHAANECLELIARGDLPGIIPDAALTVDDMMESPHIAIGTEQQIAETTPRHPGPNRPSRRGDHARLRRSLRTCHRASARLSRARPHADLCCTRRTRAYRRPCCISTSPQVRHSARNGARRRESDHDDAARSRSLVPARPL